MERHVHSFFAARRRRCVTAPHEKFFTEWPGVFLEWQTPR
jgi:hypothetical protein